MAKKKGRSGRTLAWVSAGAGVAAELAGDQLPHSVLVGTRIASTVGVIAGAAIDGRFMTWLWPTLAAVVVSVPIGIMRLRRELGGGTTPPQVQQG